jgi:hypothetical protein
MTSHLVQSVGEHDDIVRRISAAVIAESRLPAPVFRGGQRYRVGQFDDLMAVPLWAAVRAAAGACGERQITAATLDPTPEYFHQHFGHYGSLVLDVADPAEAYLDLVATEAPGGPEFGLIYNADVVAACGPSLRWRLWAQRDLNLVVLAVEPGLPLDGVGMRWLAPHDALGIMSLEFRNRQLPPDITEAFTHNYLDALDTR